MSQAGKPSVTYTSSSSFTPRPAHQPVLSYVQSLKCNGYINPTVFIATVSIQAHILSSYTQTCAVASRQGSLPPLFPSSVQFPPLQLEEASCKRTVSQILLPTTCPISAWNNSWPHTGAGINTRLPAYVTSSEPAPRSSRALPRCSLSLSSIAVPLLLDHCIETGLGPGLRDHGCPESIWLPSGSHHSCIHGLIYRLILRTGSTSSSFPARDPVPSTQRALR